MNCIEIKRHRAAMLALGLGLVLGSATLPASASGIASSASSEVSSAGSSGSSTSVEASSNSSSGKDKVAEGPYKIIEVAEALPRDGGTAPAVRLKLQAQAQTAKAGGGDFFLYLPQAAYDRSRLGVGDVVLAQHRSYGLAFARDDSKEAFFLVLDDAWRRELQTKPVGV
jgi:hypothetical protein